MAISAPGIPTENDNPLDQNFSAPPPVVEPDTTTSTGGGQGGGASTSSSGGGGGGDGGGAQVAPPGPVAQRNQQRGRMEPGPGVPNQDIFPTRVGVGPGGPAMGFDEAYRMLNTPTSLGQVQGQVGAAQQRGQDLNEQFMQAAGGDISFGEEQRATLAGALAPGAGDQQYQAARDVLFRQYGGPMAMGQKKNEEDEGPSPWEKTRRVAGASQVAGEAMGTGGGRAALYQLQGLTPGQARAQTETQFGQEGYSREARQTGAKAGEVYAGLGQQLKESSEIGQQRMEQAHQAGEQARAEFSGTGERIISAAEERAGATNKAIRDSQEAYADFVETGDMEGLAGHINTSVFEGHMSVQAAEQAWNNIWSKDEYKGIAEYAPLQLGLHYTGQQMLSPTEDTMRMWRNDARFSSLQGVFDQMRGGKGRLPGRWMDVLMGEAQHGGKASWGDLTPKQQVEVQRSYSNQWGEAEINMDTAEQRYTAAVDRGVQARDLLGVIQQMKARNDELAVDFAQDLPELQDTPSWGGIRTADEIAVEGANVNLNRTGYGGYTGRHWLRPTTGGRGQYAGIRNIYGQRLGAFAAPDLRDINEGFISGPEGVATWQSELTSSDATTYNTIQELLGQAEANLAAGQQIDPRIQVDLEKLIAANQKYTEEADAELSENELNWREKVREARDRYLRMKGEAESSWFSHSADYKRPPTYAQGGVRDVPTEADWGTV